MTKWLLAVALWFTLAISAPAAQAPAWPGLNDPRLNGFIHDELHAVTAIAVAEGLGLVTNWKSETRYGLSAIVLPVAQEAFDYVYWTRIRGLEFSLDEATKDIVTYQSAWTVHFIRKKKWGFALAAFVLPTAFNYARHF